VREKGMGISSMGGGNESAGEITAATLPLISGRIDLKA
jgi:hypothetical protein